MSWGNLVVLGTAKSCTVTCPGLEGDSRTGGHQVTMWGLTQSQQGKGSTAPMCTQCFAPADTPDSSGSRGVLSTAVSLSLPGMGARSKTAWTGTLPSGQ